MQGQVKPPKVNPMSQRILYLLAAFMLFSLLRPSAHVFAQEQPTPAQQSQPTVAIPADPVAAAAPVPATPSAPAENKIVLPAGTRVPLVLRNGLNTRTAKVGDSVYFETIYPIAQDNRIVIPMGAFMRGQLLEAKRPGRIKGRGEFRLVLDQITFPNGYTLSLAASPSSVDRNGKEGVDSEGKIKGPGSVGKDVGTVLTTTAGGAFIGTFAGLGESGAPGTGALIGGAFGGTAGLLAVLLTRGPEAELPRGTTMDVVLDHPLTLDAGHLPSGSDPGKFSQPLAPADPDQPGRRERPRRPPSLLHSMLPLLLHF